MKLWGGRFNEETDHLLEEFNASIGFDWRLYHYDIQGSKAHVEMLARTGIIADQEKELILSGLEAVEEEIAGGEIDLDPALEDIHTLVEKLLIDKVGDVGKKLHTGRSRNDQVALDIRLYLRSELSAIQSLLLDFLAVLLDLADRYQETIFPGYTHLQRAQPVTFGHHLLAYYFKLKRDYDRWQDNYKRINLLPLGAGALAGTSFPIDREWVAEKLGFSGLCLNSIDAVSDRDFALEFLSIAASLMMHLSRFSEELILWSSSEYGFIELADSYTTGSSIMPQKKNPDLAELVRGKTGRVYGHLVGLLTLLKGLPLAYNKDLQEDKEGLFDTVDTLKKVLSLFPGMLKTVKLNQGKMKEAAGSGFLNATELANYLVRKGLPFRQAHEVVGKAVLYALDKGIELEAIPPADWEHLLPDYQRLYSAELKESLELGNCVHNSNSTGGPAPVETERIVNLEKDWLEKEKGLQSR